MFWLHNDRITNGPTGARNCTLIQLNSSPAFVDSHLLVGDIGIAHLRLRVSGNHISCQLVVTFRLNVPSMILVEISNLVHEVDRSRHVIRNSDVHCTILPGVAFRLIEWRVVQILFLFNTIHDYKQGNRKCNESYSHDYIKQDGFLESCFPQLAVNEQQIHELIPILIGARNSKAITLLHDLILQLLILYQ